MKPMTKQFLGAVAISSIMLAATPMVHAGRANPINGYQSLFDAIGPTGSGANFGRCNALGVLAAKVCAANNELSPPITGTMLLECGKLGVYIWEDPAVDYCITVDPPSCEDLGTC